MKNWKRLLSVMLALVLAGTMISGIALAEEKTKVDVPFKSIKVSEAGKKITLYLDPEYGTQPSVSLEPYVDYEFEDVTIDPDKEDPIYDSFMWTSSNVSVGFVDMNGSFRPRNTGTVTVTVASCMKPSIKDTFTIEVKDYPVVKSITFNAASYELNVFEPIKPSKIGTMAPDDGRYQTIDIKSSDPEVALVDNPFSWEYCTIQGRKEGSATITVTVTNIDNSKVTGSFTVTVTENKLTALSFTKSSVTIDRAQQDSIDLYRDYLVFTPDNADSYDLLWESSNEEVATVDADGDVYARKAGTTTITVRAAKYKGIEASIEVIVVEYTGITELKFDEKTLTLYFIKKDGKLLDDRNSQYVPLIIQPALASRTVKNITWTTSNAKVAIPQGEKYWDDSIDAYQYGATITAVGKGTCIITAYVKDGTSSYNASFKVKVKENSETAKLNKKSATLKVGEKLLLKATDANKKTKLAGKWSSSDASVAKVNKKGVVKAKAPGRAVITFKPTSSKMKPVSCVIKVVAK